MANLSAEEFRARLRVIKEEAPGLIEAGITEVEVDGFKATMSTQSMKPLARAETTKPEPTDPLLDPHTYGLPEGSRVPGLSHLIVLEDKRQS